MSRRTAVIMASVLMLAAALFFLQSQRKTIAVSDYGQTAEIATYRGTVGEVVRFGGYELGEKDRTVPAADEEAADGMTIEIKRAFAVTVEDGNLTREVLTSADTVEMLLAEECIGLGFKDWTEPSMDTLLGAGDTVSITRISEETIVKRETVPFSTEIRKNPDWGLGESLTLQGGVDGVKYSTYKAAYENGIKTGEEKVAETLVRKAVPEIIEKGEGRLLVASRGDLRYDKSMIMTSTAYDLSVESCGKTPDHPEYGITFSGTRARRGVVAVDPRVIPLGTRLYVESLDGRADYGFAVAEDTGSAVKGDIIDLFMENESDVAAYGKRKVRVYILE